MGRRCRLFPSDSPPCNRAILKKVADVVKYTSNFFTSDTVASLLLYLDLKAKVPRIPFSNLTRVYCCAHKTLNYRSAAGEGPRALYRSIFECRCSSSPCPAEVREISFLPWVL